MGLKKDILKVGSSNFIVLISSIVTGLVLPSVLTLIGYADFKTFSLYASFLGFLHLGFVDGLNVKYGGYKNEDIDRNEFENYHRFFLLFQIIISVIGLATGLILKMEMLAFLSLAVIPVNLQSFFLFFYQAIGEFKAYSKSTIIVPICNILLTIFLLLINVRDFRAFILTNIISYILSIGFLEFNYYRSNSQYLKNSIKLKQFIENININWFLNEIKSSRNIFISGFLIMFGNVLFTQFFNTGRWMSKLFGTDEEFAIYSLSISLIGFILVFVAAINKTFYPYLHRNQDDEIIVKLKNTLYVIGSISFSLFFALRIIILEYLPKYIDALPVAAILITSIPGIFIVQSIYVNLYKVQKNEHMFLIDTLLYLLIGLFLNVIFYFYFKTLNAIAVASVLSIYIWVIFPLNFVKSKIRSKVLEIGYLVIILLNFYLVYICGFNFVLSILLSAILLFMILPKNRTRS